MVTEQPDKHSAMSAKQSEFSVFILCIAVKLQQYYLICAMKIILVSELEKRISEVLCLFRLISMARLSNCTNIFVDSSKVHQEQCYTVFFPCFSFGLVHLQKEGVSDASAREKKYLFEHNVQGFFPILSF